MIILHRIPQGSPEWLELRRGLYTGSNADKLLKFGTIDYSRTDDNGWGGNFHTKRGHILEDEAIELYEAITGIKVDRPGFVTNTRYPECGYSPDGLVPDRTIEVKSFIQDKHEAAAKYVPFEILAQCHFGKLICDKKLCDLLLYNPDLPADQALIIITIKHKAAIQANFRRKLREGKNVKSDKKLSGTPAAVSN